MNITLKNLIERNVFEKIEIHSGAGQLDRTIRSVSIMETPDFEKYILENTLVLTTLYPIRNEMDLFKKLLYTLSEKKACGLVVKVKRYIDQIPDDIATLAKELQFPIITLEYDANLSLLFDAIIAEIHHAEYSTTNFNALYSTILHSIVENPSSQSLINSIKTIDDIEVLIVNLITGKIHYSDEKIMDYYQNHSTSSYAYAHEEDDIIYSETISYDQQDVYQLLVMAPYEKRYIIYNYIEILKLMIILIYQKKQENLLKQNQFLMDFVMNMTSNYNTNLQIIEASRIFNWKIKFPIMLVMIQLKEQNNQKVDPSVFAKIRNILLHQCHIQEDEIRMVFLTNHLLLIANIREAEKYTTLIHQSYLQIKETLPDTFSRLAYSSPILFAKEIPDTYAALLDTLIHANKHALNIDFIQDYNVRILNLLKKVDHTSLLDFANSRLSALLQYEKKNQLPLAETYYRYIECKFNAKETANQLYIHYNSLRYRLNLIESLGYPLNDVNTTHFDIYLALYIHLHFSIDKG